MKISRFNVLAQKDKEEKILLYNTFNDAQILCDEKKVLLNLFEKLENHETLDPEEDEVAHTLYDLGFLIDDHLDEQKEFLNWFDTKIRNNFERLSTLILTSRTCNLRCPYCFERDVLDAGLNMKQETAEQLVKWLIARIDKHHPKNVDITFFGGEPLMNVPVLKFIASRIHERCRQDGLSFEFGMITNGVMLTPQLVSELKQWGFKWVKITIDGDKPEHDKLRITKSGKGTFDKIWGNLEKIKGMIPVYIGGNFDPRNQESLPRLADKIAEASFRDTVFSVEFKPIQENFEGAYHTAPIRTDCAEPAFSPEQIDIMMNSRKYLASKRLPTNNQIGIGPCELHRKSFFGVDMDGNLYKCSAMVGREDFASGNIRDGEDEEKVEERMGTGIRPWKDCGPCPFIPVCAGGCKATGYDRYGDFTVGSCDKLYFKAMVQEMFEKNLEEATVYEDGLQYNKVRLNEPNVGVEVGVEVGPLTYETHGQNLYEGTESFAV